MTIAVDPEVCLVFDLDDTLYKEIDFLKSAYLDIAQKCNPENYKHTYAHMLALYRQGSNVFEFMQDRFKVNKMELIERYRNHLPNIQLKPHTEELFQSIKGHKGKIGLLTDGRSITQRKKIQALGLEDFCDCIIISEEIGSEKPAEENFKAVEHTCNSSSYYYIADNMKKDFITPKALGWGTVGLIDNGLNIHVYPDYYDNTQHIPQEYIFDLSDLSIISR